jgi:aspartate/methionine/tyrosine aminotransferase
MGFPTLTMEIAPFAIEHFYARYEFAAEHMLSSSDCESWSIEQLLALEPDAPERLSALRLGYTEVRGSPELREAIAATYETIAPEDVLVLSCAEEAIFTVLHSLLRPGDHAVIETPCYGSALEVARSTGADVARWRRRFEDGWAYDVDALHGALRAGTRLLYVNTPHNPTGTQMPAAVFEAVADVARERDVALLSDEVYRELEHDPADRRPAACDVHPRGISLGSVSKTYGLPGLRLGWIATRDPQLLRAVEALKLYTTICSSAPSELLAAIAVRNRGALIGRNLELVRRNLPLVAALVEARAELLSWVEPTAGPIAFPRVSPPADAASLCDELVEQASVLLLPGSVFGQPQHVRVGFGRAGLPEALARFDEYLDRRAA